MNYVMLREKYSITPISKCVFIKESQQRLGRANAITPISK
jgi:hypothetical protein